MLVFPVLALAQFVSAVPLDSIFATTLLSQRETTPSVTIPSPSLQPEALPKPSTLFNFFQSSSTATIESSEWGDSIHDHPGELHRIYFQNIDGLRNDDDEISLCVSSMAQLNVGTFCWADPGLDFSRLHVRQSLTCPINKHFLIARHAFSSCTIPIETISSMAGSSGYQPGGTFTSTTDKWATRSTGKPLVDPSGLGRWSGLCFIGKRGKRLALLTAYRSPRQQPTGGFGFFDQQYTMLLSNGHPKPNVRKQFIVDLVQFINTLQLEGHEVLVSLDANETRGQDTTYGIARLLQECTLTDLHTLGSSDPPATYKYGTDRRIDYMFGSQAVAEAVCRAGYNAYDSGIFSKHRGLFIDLDFQLLMGTVDSITPARARILRSEDQPSVDRYLDAFKRYADDHRLWQRVQELTTLAPCLTPPQCKDNFDAIDRDVTRAMLHAERKARKPAGKYAWSPKLREAGLLARYWHLRLCSVERGRNLRAALLNLQARLSSLQIDPQDDSTQDLTLLKTRWKEALQLLRTVRDTAYDHRNIHLLSILTDYQTRTFSASEKTAGAQRNNELKIQRIIRLLNTEGMRKPFRTIKSTMTESHPGGLSKLFVPNGVSNPKVAAKYCKSDGSISHDTLIAMAQSDKLSVTYDTILDCDAIEEELNRYNREWFRQASNTPFGSGELYDLVGYDGLTETATSIVNGDCIDYLGVPMSRPIQVFLEECKRPDSILPIQTDITTEQFVDAIKKWKESTSTSPSGRHLGHYRTAILDDAVTTLHTQLLNIPIQYGFAPARWTYSVTPLIEKDPGRPFLTRLRVIHLFEADYNLFLKIIFGRRMVKNAEAANALNDQQHGSRPRRMTTDALFYARLEKDLIRQTKMNSAHMDNDATGCYDRIVTSLGMIACRRLGMPDNAIRCQAEVLRQMHYSIKHSYGISSRSYTGTEAEPLFGTGQGSGASPAIWLGLVVILLNSLDRMSCEDDIPGLDFADPWSDFRVRWRVGAFVDDTNQGVLDPSGSLSVDELVEKLRCAGQLWESLLHTSGGSLNLAKCSWTVQYWQWINGRPSLQPFSTLTPPLLMTSGASPEHHIIHQHNNATEIKGLGVNMNFHGTFAYHAQQMRIKFDTMARRLRQSNLSSTLSRKYYDTFYIPSVTYSLPVTSLPDSSLHRIQSLMTATILNKLGYNRHFPHAVAFAPSSVFGCGLRDLTIEQGLQHIQAVLDYVGTQHKIGELILISLRHLQVEAGVSFDLLQNPQILIPYLTDCWVLHLRRFCAQHVISLTLRCNKFPSICREGDQLLMDKALTLGFTKRELLDINLVRIFLGVTAVSDIATANGHAFHLSAWNGIPISDRRSRLTFARQESPTKSQRHLWRRLLKSFLPATYSSQDLTLLVPLGSWTSESTMRWSAMMWDNNLYRCNPTIPHGQACHARHISVHFPRRLPATVASNSLVYYDNVPDWYTATIPALASPTDITGCHVFTTTHASTNFPSIAPPASTFPEWTLHLPAAERRLLASPQLEACDAEQTLIQYLQIECTLLIGTDGGKKETHGSFAWIICSPCKEKLILNSGPVDGWFKCQSSLRSEAAALASLTLYLDELTEFHQVTIRCTFCLYVDSMSAITNVTTLRDLIPRRRFPNHADVLSTISSANHVLKHFILHHVPAHQDDETCFEDLSFPAQLNVLCDKMATAQLKRQLHHAEDRTLSNPKLLRTLNVAVSVRNQIISSHYIPLLRKSISLHRHRLFLQQKYNWSNDVWDSIAWESLFACATKPDLDQKVNRSKLTHNWLNLGAQRAKFGNGGTTTEIERRCPYCKQAEDFIHLLSCGDSRACKARYDAMIPLRTASAKSRGGSELLRALKTWTAHPTALLQQHEPCFDPLLQSLTDTAIKSQEAIGWAHTFRGFVSSVWDQFDLPSTPVTANRKKTPNIMANIIRALQDYTLHLWKSRNEVLHATGSDTTDIVHATLNSHITQLYSLQSSFSPIIQSYFTIPLEVQLRRCPRHRRRWLCLARLATASASARGTRQQLLSTYFPHAPSLLTATTSSPNEATGPSFSPVTMLPPSRQQSLPQHFFSQPAD